MDYKTLIVETSYGEAKITFEVLKTTFGAEFNTYVLFAQDRVVICRINKRTKECEISTPIDTLVQDVWNKVKKENV